MLSVPYYCRRTPVKGILKSRPVTPCPEMFDKVKLFEKSKEVADSALNIINPYRSHIATVL